MAICFLCIIYQIISNDKSNRAGRAWMAAMAATAATNPLFNKEAITAANRMVAMMGVTAN